MSDGQSFAERMIKEEQDLKSLNKSAPSEKNTPEKPREKSYRYCVVNTGYDKWGAYPNEQARAFEDFEEAKDYAVRTGGKLFGLSPEYEITVTAVPKTTWTLTTTNTQGTTVSYPAADFTPCDHVWIYNGSGTIGTYYYCSKCGCHKTEPVGGSAL